MLHVRVVTPEDRRDVVLALLLDHPAVRNVVSWPGAAQRPDGDLVQFDLATEAANDVIASLRSLRIDRDGSLAIVHIDAALSDAARTAEQDAPGQSSEAVIWEAVEARVREDATLSVSHVLFTVLAAMIAAVGILTDSPILIVGAMVLGPDFGPLASVALGVHQRHRVRFVRGLTTMAVSFTIAVAAAALLAVLIRSAGRTPDSYLDGLRPFTAFISDPDEFSILVAALAAVAGMLSLTQARFGSMVGVLISVTTIPALGDIGVALAHTRGREAAGAAWQLLLNVTTVVLVGAITLRIETHVVRRRTRQRRPG